MVNHPETHPEGSSAGKRSAGGTDHEMYLTQDEFRALARLSTKNLSKTRYSVPPFGIHVFEGTLEGLLLAEAEFDSAAAADALTLPSFIFREVSADNHLTGGQLVCASWQEIQT